MPVLPSVSTTSLAAAFGFAVKKSRIAWDIDTLILAFAMIGFRSGRKIVEFTCSMTVRANRKAALGMGPYLLLSFYVGPPGNECVADDRNTYTQYVASNVVP